jgi:hypothetical protein
MVTVTSPLPMAGLHGYAKTMTYTVLPSSSVLPVSSKKAQTDEGATDKDTTMTQTSEAVGARIFHTDGAMIDEQRALGNALKALAHAAKDVPAEQFAWAVLTPVAAVFSILLAPEHDEHLVADFSQTLAAVRLLQRQTEGGRA